jgi:predicted ATPase
VPAVADALNFPLQGDGRSPQQRLLDYLRQKKILLLLDNFEHLLDGVNLVTNILQPAPDVQILVTSRERLHLRVEQVYPIEGLEFPDWATVSPSGENEDAQRYTAVQLFLQSARRNQPDFVLHAKDDLTYLAHICRIVAGMPLALELAASWVDMLPLSEIAAELQKGLDFLETDIRDMPERHRSIRTAIDYSWQKLDEKERAIFAKLSVFRGGFTREAAQAVAGANLRPLARLVSKSLVQAGREEGRYQIHELLRQYGAEKLEESGEETAVRQKHSHFYCAALHSWEAELKSARQ